MAFIEISKEEFRKITNYDDDYGIKIDATLRFLSNIYFHNTTAIIEEDDSMDWTSIAILLENSGKFVPFKYDGNYYINVRKENMEKKKVWIEYGNFIREFYSRKNN